MQLRKSMIYRHLVFGQGLVSLLKKHLIRCLKKKKKKKGLFLFFSLITNILEILKSKALLLFFYFCTSLQPLYYKGLIVVFIVS